MSESKTSPSARLEEVDLFRLRHMLGGLLMLVALWGVALVDNASPVIALIAILAGVAGIAAPRLFFARSARFWNLTGWAVVALALSDLATAGLNDRSQLIPAVIRVALYIAILRTLQPRTRREDMQLILLSLFLGAVGGALSLSPLFAVQVFLFIPISGGILFLLNRMEGSPRKKLEGEDWKNFRWIAFAGRIRAALTPGTLVFLAGCMLAVMASGALIFVMLPRFRMDQAVPFLQLPGSGKTGFSDSVTLGSVGDLIRDEAVALRADTPERRRPVSSVYWRMIALDAYESAEGTSGFSLSPSSERIYLKGSSRSVEWKPGSPPKGAAPSPLAGEWHLYPEGNVSRYIPVPGVARRVRFDNPQDWQENEPMRILRLRQTPSAGVPTLEYLEGDSTYFPATVWERSALAKIRFGNTGDYPANLLDLPREQVSRDTLLRTAGEFSTGNPGAREFAKRASDWLARRHAYALRDGYGRKKAGPGEPFDYLVRWMNSEATGWCEHYASSLVLLARAGGYPARLVTGFCGGDWNESENYLVVRMRHAHAWAEIYDQDTGVWIRVDPTPSASGAGTQAAEDLRSAIASYSGLNAWYDSLTMLWFRRVVNFEENDQRETAKETADTLASWGREIAGEAKAWRDALAAKLREIGEAPVKIFVPALGLALLAGLVWSARRLLKKLSLFRLRTAGDDDPRVRRFRERAGRDLVRIRAAERKGWEVDARVKADVERVRFGKPSEWPDPDAAAEAVGPALRLARKQFRKAAPDGVSGQSAL